MSGSPSLSGRGQGVKKEAKTLLRNILRHTDTHNRRLEESDMWQQYSKLKARGQSSSPSAVSPRRHERQKSKDESNTLRDPNVKNSFLYDDRQDVQYLRHRDKRKSGSRRAHMDDTEHRYPGNGALESGHTSTYWMRQLQKTEEGDSERWGHSGFKELYPKVFESDRSDQSDSSSTDTDTSSSSRHARKQSRRNRRKPSRSGKGKSLERERDRKKRLHKEKKLKQKRRTYSDSESEEDDSHGRKKRKKQKKKNRSKVDLSDEEGRRKRRRDRSEIQSDDSYSYKRRRRK